MKLYIIRSKDGKFFRAIGQRGGENWVSEMEKARIYTKIGPARAQITFWFKNYPKYGCADLLEFNLEVEKADIINMVELTNKSIGKIEKKKLEREKREQDSKLEGLKRRKKEIDEELKKYQN